MKRLLLVAAAGVITVVGATVGGLIAPAAAGDGPLPPEVREVRAAVARYHSFKQAERDGYTVEGEPCVASPAGTMGIHAVNPALLADDAIDVRRPELLLYVPKSNGKLEFVGVEYLEDRAGQYGCRPEALVRRRRTSKGLLHPGACSGRPDVRWPDGGPYSNDALALRPACLGCGGESERCVRPVQSRDLLLGAER